MQKRTREGIRAAALGRSNPAHPTCAGGEKLSRADAAAVAPAPIDESQPPMLLLNLMCAPPSSALGELRRSLVRLEALSHILVWSSTAGGTEAAATIDVVELPRLRLTFRADRGRLYCDDLSGLFVSNVRDPQVSGPGVFLELRLRHPLLLEAACDGTATET